MGRRNTGGDSRLSPPRKRKPIKQRFKPSTSGGLEPHPNPFVQSDIEDAERTLKWLRKEDMSRELQWIDKDKGIPTAWYAGEVLAKQNGIRCIHREVFRGMDRRFHSIVRATVGHGKLRRTHNGASVWTNKEIAQCFAFRNAIRQLLPMQPNTTEQTAWTDTKENILATELKGQGLSKTESRRQASEAYD